MAVYSMGKLVSEPEVNAPSDANQDGKSKAIKHGYFCCHRTEWTQLDATIVEHLLKLKTMEDIAKSLGMKESYFYKVLLTLRKVKHVNSNRELVALALKEGIISLSVNPSLLHGEDLRS